MSHIHPAEVAESGEAETQADARNLNSRRSMDLVKIVKKAVSQVPRRSTKAWAAVLAFGGIRIL